MKVTKRRGSDTRLVLNRMVTDIGVLGPIAAKWQAKMFADRASNLIAGWAVRYYQKYAKAPGKAIALDYDRWAESQRDTEVADAIGTFLESLSAETKRFATIGTDVVLDTAALVFDKVQIERQHEEAKAALDRGDIARAREISNSFRPVSVATTSGLSVFKSGAVTRNAFRNIDQSLVKWDQEAMRRFFAGMLARDEFIVFIAPEKRGKSFWLQEVCFQAVLSKLKVAMFEVGDQSQRQILRRFAARAAGRPAKSDTRVLYPISIEPGEMMPELAYDERAYDLAMTPKEADLALKSWGKKYGRDQFRLSVHPNSTINMAGIAAVLDDWARDNWIPDVVCIAEGSKVLTDRGLVPIESVSKSHRLWDGVSWVRHGGIVCKGIRDVISYCGLSATADHKVWTDHGWRTLESCRRMGLPIAHTGENGTEIRVGQDYFSDYPMQKVPQTKIRANVLQSARVCSCCLRKMQSGEVGFVAEHSSGICQGLPFMYAAQASNQRIVQSIASGTESLSESQESDVQTLWEKRNRIPFRFGYDSLPLDYEENRDATTRTRIRSERQRWTLRTGEFAVVHPQTEYCPYQKESINSQNAPFSSTLSRDQLCQRHASEILSERIHTRRNNSSMEIQSLAVRKSRVWDIRNSGPLSRFTVQGVLVHNCVDYMDILAPMQGNTDSRDQINANWKAARSLNQKLHCLFVTATQGDADSYDAEEITMSNFSDDKRKNAHCTGTIGINQNEQEKGKGLYRLKWTLSRDLDFNTSVWCAGCLAVANPCVLSCFN